MMNEATLTVLTSVGPKPIGPDTTVVNHWFWKFVPVDPLVFSPPSHDGSVLQIARQVYHRMLSRMVAESAHSMQLGLIVAAWLFTVFFGGKLSFRGGTQFGSVLGLAAFGAFLFFVIPVLMRIACPSSASSEARSIVTRAFFRELPDNTPADLHDELQMGWLTAEGKPLSSEITAEDGRTTEATKRSIWWVVTAIAIGWAVSYAFSKATGSSSLPTEAGPDAADQFPGGAGFPGLGSMIPGLGFLKLFGSFVVFLILLVKLIFDKRPLVTRANELSLCEEVEGAAYVAAGGQAWGTIPEAARMRQIKEAAGDPTPVVELGQTTGVFAGRGDFFAPNAGLPFRMSLRDLQMHMLVLGGTGSGKTSGVLRPLARQLTAFQGVGVVIMDGKGALPGELADLPGMRVVDPGQPGTDVSLVSGVEPSVIVDTIREILAPAGEGGGQDQFWVNSATGALRRGAVIAQAAGGAWWSLYNAAHVVSNKQDRDALIEALVPKAENDALLREAFEYFRFEWDVMDEKTRSNILAEIRSWLSTITATPELLRWAKTPAGRDSVDITSPLTGGRLGILIPEYRYGVAGSVVSALIKARIYSGLKARAERDWSGTAETPVVFIIDEAQEVATAQDAQMLPIGRSLGLAMIAATQGIEGIKVKLNEAVADKWLAIFGSVVALGGRSGLTDAFVAQRAGETWQLTPSQIEGNTVRGALSMGAVAGPYAAARTQPHMAMTVAKGGVAVLPSRIASAVGTLAKRGKDALDKQTPPHMNLGSRPIVPAGEIASLAAIPDTAVVLATRGRVARRDIVTLKPEYAVRAKAQAAPRRIVAVSGAPAERQAMAASAQ